MNQNKILETINQITNHAKQEGLAHLITEDDSLNHNLITFDGKKHINFGSCSYLGLEFHQKVMDAAKSAIDSYGTQFSSSRAYVSPIYYLHLESKLEKIFQSPTLVTPTTTLGHMAALPVLISSSDAVILDHQVHNSVQTAAKLLKAEQTHIELLRHNRMDLLESRIKKLRGSKEKIWYLADGIYSMYGDAAPLDEIYYLLDKYPEFHFYVDDAHGMSCYGERGRGFVLANRKIHERMIVATSFAKAFATGGGALIFPNKEIAQKVRNCGGPLITSGPMQPAGLGAANAVADIHLSGEIEEYQKELKDKIEFTNSMLKKYNLLNLAEAHSPIFFIAVSLPKVAYRLVNIMKNAGFFLNLGIFPAVPIKNTGIRFTITRLHTLDQIEKMIKCLAEEFPKVLLEENITMEEIYKAFRIKQSKTKNEIKAIKHIDLIINNKKSINEISKEKWNGLMENRGIFDWKSLSLLENTFKDNSLNHQNWDFDYIIISDPDDNVILATLLTTHLSKDDLFAKKETSLEIEKLRESDPYYMTSKTLSIGTPLTEGEHLYLNRDSKFCKEALNILLQKISSIQDEKNISNIILRDFPMNNQKFDHYMINNGYFKMQMPATFKIKNITYTTEEGFYKQLSKNNKKAYRKFITKHRENFEISFIDTPGSKDLEHFYELYLNVKNKSTDLNTFTLPFELFQNISLNPKWEILSLSLKSNIDTRDERKPVSMALCYKGKSEYVALIAGIDFDFNTEYFCYRQLLANIVKRGYELKYKNIALGYTANVEKKRFGATELSYAAYMQMKDNYNLEAINMMST